MGQLWVRPRRVASAFCWLILFACALSIQITVAIALTNRAAVNQRPRVVSRPMLSAAVASATWPTWISVAAGTSDAKTRDHLPRLRKQHRVQRLKKW